MTSKRRPVDRRGAGRIPLLRLERMGRDDLVRLARRLLRERRRRGGSRDRRPLVDPDEVASKVSSALDIDWESPSRGARREVEEHAMRARTDLRGGRWDSALRRATGVVQSYADGYDPGDDREGDLASDLHDAVAVVDEALKHARGTSSRDAAFDALLGLWWADLGHGGVGLSDDVPGILRERATKEERVRIADEVQKRLKETQPGFEREHAARMLVDLDGSRFTNEAYLEFCRTNGLHMERVARLVSRKRFQEAANVAETDVPRYRLTEAAELLVKGGHRKLAVRTVESCLQDPADRAFHDRWKEWLQGEAESWNNLPRARQLAWERLLGKSSMATYDSFKRVSRRARSWVKDEGTVLDHLSRPDLGHLLTEVHLEEGRVSEALRTLRAWTNGDRIPDWSDGPLKERVARAAQKDFPKEARDLYLELAEAFISHKTRGAYAHAAPLVKVACALEMRVHGREGPTEVLRSFHQRYEGFPALWDEFGKVGLR